MKEEIIMTKNMTTGSPVKLILMFTLPLIVGNVFQQFYNLADTLIVGRTLGVNSLAAVGCTGSISFLILGFVTGLSSGLSIITAQRFGAGDERGVKRSFAAGIVISAVTAVIVTILSVLFADLILTALQTPAEIKEEAAIYIRIIFYGIPASLLFNYLSNILRALGDSKTPLYFLVFACCVNVVLDFVCILTFHMGVAGAGVATVFSQMLSGVMCIVFIWKKIPMLWLGRDDMKVTGHDLKIHLWTGLPMAFQTSIIAVGSLILQYALNGLGALSVAATTTASKIESIATMPMNSFGMTMSTYAAQNYGAGKIDRIREGVFKCILMSVGFSIAAGFVNIFFGKELAGLFIGSGETQVLEMAQVYLKITGSLYFVLALLFIYRFTLQGMGHGLVPTIAGVMELIMRTFAALILTDLFGFAGASASGPLAWIGACIPLAAAHYYGMHKLMRRQAEADPQRVQGRKWFGRRKGVRRSAMNVQ